VRLAWLKRVPLDKGAENFVMNDNYENSIRIHKASLRELEDALRDILLACRDKATPKEIRFAIIEYTARAAWYRARANRAAWAGEPVRRNRSTGPRPAIGPRETVAPGTAHAFNCLGWT
jgi:hypothetical protein